MHLPSQWSAPDDLAAFGLAADHGEQKLVQADMLLS
jgi:hypothetical protein|tara:strand:+ start:138 stop:245 length:108 start_codon:yes stop_codon:yes gene_type:complete